MTTQERMGLKIKSLREEKKISQTVLAEMVGYKDKTSIAKIEAGKVDLPQSKIFAFAKALNTTTSYLFSDEEDSSNEATTIAAHFDGDEYTEEEFDKIKKFAALYSNKISCTLNNLLSFPENTEIKQLVRTINSLELSKQSLKTLHTIGKKISINEDWLCSCMMKQYANTYNQLTFKTFYNLYSTKYLDTNSFDFYKGLFIYQISLYYLPVEIISNIRNTLSDFIYTLNDENTHIKNESDLSCNNHNLNQPKAAHNDHMAEPGESEKVQKDLSILKKPD